MPLLTFPVPASNGQLYPATPLPGQHQYKYDAPNQTWVLLGTATGVVAGTYGDALNVGQFSVDATGRITFAQNVPITGVIAPAFTAKGEILVGTGPGAFTALPVGTDGYALTANSACAEGVEWVASSGATPATPIAEGTVYACTTDAARQDTALGYNALGGASPISAYNTAVGSNAMASMLDGALNVAVGQGALRSSVSDIYNVAVGYDALACVNGAGGNTAVGQSALCQNTTGTNNVAIGSGAMYLSSLPSNNVAVGWNSLSNANVGDDNVAIGPQAMRNVEGCFNIAMGSLAGSNITTGSRNVAIGPDSNVLAPTGSCQLAIGFSATDNWLTGDSSKAIKPGAGIIDSGGSSGTTGQVLMSTGTNAVCWGGGLGVTGTYTFGTCTVVITNGIITSVT